MEKEIVLFLESNKKKILISPLYIKISFFFNVCLFKETESEKASGGGERERNRERERESEAGSTLSVQNLMQGSNS